MKGNGKTDEAKSSHLFIMRNEIEDMIQKALDFQRENMFTAISRLVAEMNKKLLDRIKNLEEKISDKEQ